MNKDKIALWKTLKGLNEVSLTEESSAVKNKKLLLEMAERGEPRPNKKHPLGGVLCDYLRKTRGSYDVEFDKQIRKIAPQWFADTAAENKKLLLEMAERGEPRPNKKHPLGGALCNYLNKTRSYDTVFDKQIRKIAPQWFADTAAENKKLLLDMAERGEPRPTYGKHPLGVVLFEYLRKTRGSYDVEFDKQIRKLAPQWFTDTVAENKKLLLEMAHQGEPRPVGKKHPLGIVFGSYVSKSHGCYDAEFDKQIRKLAPQWFADTAVENKKLLLEMAERGEPRPNKRKNPLGSVLFEYLRKTRGSYDVEFDKQIRKLAPQWFADTVAENKKLLLDMAERGEPRPTYGKHSLAGRLAHYLKKTGRSYDTVFDKQIRKIAPQWFADTAAENKKLLLDMAERGEPRPRRNGQFHQFYEYTYLNRECYDPIFDKQIRALRPDWFLKSVNQYK